MRVAVVGAHPDTRMDAPYSAGDWTVWACSMQNLHTAPSGSLRADMPRFDAWFELHRPMGLHVGSGQVPEDYVAWLREQPAVYVRDEAEQFPGALRFPEADLKAQFGPYFFTSSIACMMALAIAEGADEIGVWGVGMHTHDEYAYQKPGFQYFAQRAQERGIAVTVPPGSTLLNPPEDCW